MVEELTVTKVMLLNPVPLPPVTALEAPEMKMEPAPEVSNVMVEVVVATVPLKLKALVAPNEESTAIVRPVVTEVKPLAKKRVSSPEALPKYMVEPEADAALDPKL